MSTPAVPVRLHNSPAGVTASPVREVRVQVEDKDEASESMSQTTGKGTVT